MHKAFYSLKNGAPEEYTLKKANFYSREFFVDERVLIPRNDTEVLVEEALKRINLGLDINEVVYIDIGTGSGCIPISIVKEMHPLRFQKVFMLDISPDALTVAGENISSHNLEEIVTLKESNLLH